jgi:hypothetical protein
MSVLPHRTQAGNREEALITNPIVGAIRLADGAA